MRWVTPDAAKNHKDGQLAATNFKRFSLFYDPPQDLDDEPIVLLKGPTSYLEHGQICFTSDNHSPEWLPKKIQRSNTRRRLKLSNATARKSGLIDGLFWQMAADVAVHQYYGVRYNAKYLTDLPGEAAFLNVLSKDDPVSARTASLCARLTHVIPMMMDVPLERILKIRKQEYDAFLQYRSTISRIVRDYLTKADAIGDKEAREIYTDILLPDLLKLKTQARTQRRSALKKTGVKAFISTGVIALGVFGGLLPTELTALFKAVGGVSLVKEPGEAVASIEKNPREVRNHNLYFLLRLGQEKGHHFDRR